jgi:hypothetical protein
MLQQRITDDKDVEIQEDEANDAGKYCFSVNTYTILHTSL